MLSFLTKPRSLLYYSVLSWLLRVSSNRFSVDSLNQTEASSLVWICNSSLSAFCTSFYIFNEYRWQWNSLAGVSDYLMKNRLNVQNSFLFWNHFSKGSSDLKTYLDYSSHQTRSCGIVLRGKTILHIETVFHQAISKTSK